MVLSLDATGEKEMMMQLLYNSDNYSVAAVELLTHASKPEQYRGGYEILDKLTGKGLYLEGDLALKFQREVQEITSNSDTQDLDSYLQSYDQLMHKVVQN